MASFNVRDSCDVTHFVSDGVCVENIYSVWSFSRWSRLKVWRCWFSMRHVECSLLCVWFNVNVEAGFALLSAAAEDCVLMCFIQSFWRTVLCENCECKDPVNPERGISQRTAPRSLTHVCWVSTQMKRDLSEPVNQYLEERIQRCVDLCACSERHQVEPESFVTGRL